jgi:mevalonate kinase
MIEARLTVPGKIMLAGEYAVLQGGSTLSSTISGALTVKVRGTAGKETTVSSDIWKADRTLSYLANIDDFSQEPLCQAIFAGGELFDVKPESVSVSSNLDLRHGVGTSSAVRLGVLMAMRAISSRRDDIDDWEVARTALNLQRNSQPDASGYDIATQLIGGLLRLDFGPVRPEPRWFSRSDKLSTQCIRALKQKVHIFVGGTGAPTSAVMKTTLAWINQQQLHQEIFHSSERLVHAFEAAFQDDTAAADRKLFEEMGNFRQIFTSCPDFPLKIAESIAACKNCDKTWSFKTTGAGGEDALLIAGSTTELHEVFTVLEQNGWYPMPYEFSDSGVIITVGESS